MKMKAGYYFDLMIVTVALGANLIVVAGMQYIWMPLLPSFIAFNNTLNDFIRNVENGIVYYGIVHALSFIIPSLLIIHYIIPVSVFLNQADAVPDEKLQIRIIRTPLVTALLGALGWVIGLISSNSVYFTFTEEIVPKDWFIGNMTAVTLAMVTFIFVFYTVEFFIRRYFQKPFFPDQKISHIRNKVNIDTRTRFMLLFFSSGITPSTIFLVVLIAKTESVYELILISILIGVLLASSFVIYILVSSEFERQLSEMKSVTEDILKSNYKRRLSVTSADDLGFLAEGINEMSEGLFEKERMYDIFGRIVDPEVRDHLLKSGSDAGGETRQVTVLFTDIRGFTGLSERIPAENIVRLLNIYFEKLSSIIKNNKGMVNKFIGDAVMGVFNAPLENQEHRMCALNAAAAILRETESLNRQLSEAGLPEIKIGIGLHSGQVIAGTVGSADRQEYTVIGDTVNTASRLESLNKKTGTTLLFSREVLQENDSEDFSGYTINRIGKVKVRGRAEPVEVFTFV